MNLKTLLLCAGIATVAACGGGGGIGGSGDAGGMRFQITDAPACGYEEVNITIERVRVHRDESADPLVNDGWYEVVLPTPRRINLLDLSNGVLEDLGQTPLPAGRYTQMRLVLADNDVTPLANSVVPEGRAETGLTTPSAQQSGLKLKMNIDVPADKVVDAVIDFDACKSVVKRGNSGQYNLKPVVTVTPLLSDAGLRVVGYVSPALGGGFTNVSVQFDGVPVKATVPDARGRFELYPVPVGTYDLVVTAPGRVSAVITGVPVVGTAHTVLNDAATAIDPPSLLTPARAVTGSVLPFTASVRALQFLTGGPTIEVQWAPVDAQDGSFDVLLPVQAPVRAAYAGGALLPRHTAFAADLGAAGLYTLQAQSGDSVQELDIDVGDVVDPVIIRFP